MYTCWDMQYFLTGACTCRHVGNLRALSETTDMDSYSETVHQLPPSLVSQAIRIFPRGAHARGKGGGGREGKIRLVTCARFLFRLPECWQSQSNFSIQSN